MNELGQPTQHAERIAEFAIDCARRARRADNRIDIVVLGDGLVQHNPGLAGWINRGLDGDRLRSGDGGCVFDRLGTETLHPNPLAIVVQIGIDDLRDAPADVEALSDLYGHLLAQLTMHHPESMLVVVSLLPPSGPESSLNDSILVVNARLRQLADGRGAHFCDAHSALVDPESGQAQSGMTLSDGMQLSARGYAVLNEVLQHTSESIAHEPRGRFDRGAIDTLDLGNAIVAQFGRECWGQRLGSATDNDVVANFIRPEADYLLRYLETGALTFRDLYLGSRAKFIAKNDAVWSALPGGISGLAALDATLWNDAATRQGVSGATIDRLRAVHAELAPCFQSAPRRIRLLFVGDCLLEDVELLMGAELLRQGLLADVDFIVTKNPSEQMKEIRAAATIKYDAVVYSPLSWEYDQDFRNIFSVRPQLRASLEKDAQSAIERLEKRVRLLADLFECNVFVHNTAAVLRASTDAKRAIRSTATRYKREFMRERVAAQLSALVAEINAASFEHVFIVDEAAAVHDSSDDVSLGRFLYYHDAIHPAELSVHVATQITRLVSASVRLLTKKVVVCDLDNTLWDGVIGEGLGVRHCRDRQEILALLKSRGVVLAICSKNDPANIRWQDSTLTADDFVASEVSWGPKPAGIGRIQETLNLKAKDFVFIDDRADERSMVTESFPTLTALDPCAESTWQLFRTWAVLLGTKGNADRTEMYKQRAERQKLLDATTDEQEAIETFKKLNLRLDIRRSSEGDLKRIHELINRTNQWNLQGSRCSFQDVKTWHDSPSHRIYSARVKDKFGDMGLISVCVAEFKEQALEIDIFVLSCRVFGYGVETLMLRKLEADATVRFGVPAVRGVFVSTSHNGPSRDFYPRHGYEEIEGAWSKSASVGSAPDPTWFERVSTE